MKFTFAVASEDDFERLLAIRHAAMRPSLERVGRWEPERARNRFRASFVPADTRLILVDDALAGCVAPRTRPDALEIDQFYLAPPYHGRGLGSAVLRRLLAEADGAGLPVVLTVLRDSDAIRLYERYGFTRVGEEAWDLHYRRPTVAPST
ncbi:MAG TPA: GNAT family N-acetyltransferase [Stellaceae bacterium]|nr:GNAT family N-acetyltransferase [Stellaceae bacterium]